MIFYPNEAVMNASREMEYTLVLMVCDKQKTGEVSQKNKDLFLERALLVVDAIAEQWTK